MSDTLKVGGETYEIFRLDALQEKYDVARLPYSLKVLLENLLRNGSDEGAEAVATWDAKAEPSKEIAYSPSRVLMQDFTGVPAIVDLAAMRDAMEDLGGDPTAINPLVPVELVIDHSIQVDSFAEKMAFQKNAEREYERNRERYAFLRWGQTAFENFAVVPPNTGICHQVNLEYLSRVVAARDGQAFPDTLVGTDSHTTMVNGLGVLGWGVGGIEAEAAMLGQPVSMLLPQVVGFRLEGELPEGSTATDLVLTVTEMLRERGVVGKFVEFFGPGLANLPLADRATIGNMSPEFGSTCAIFPVDAETLRYLEFSGRPLRADRAGGGLHAGAGHVPRRGLRGRHLLRHAGARPLHRRAVAGGPEAPAGPGGALERRHGLPRASWPVTMATTGATARAQSFPASDPPATSAEDDDGEPAHQHGNVAVEEVAKASASVSLDGNEFELEDGAVVIAAITSCTNTSNPSVMLGAGILARNAVERGLKRKPWVKTSLAPGSKVVTDYLDRSGLTEPLERARLQPRGLRLHHLHRQLGPAAGRDLGGDRGRGPHRLLGAVGQPQLRGPHPPRGEDELPRLAAAVRGLRAGRADGPRHRGGPARRGRRRRAGLPARPVADAGRR